MIVFILIGLIIFFAIILLYFAYFNYFSIKNNNFCEKLININELFCNKKIKYSYQKLKKSHSNFLIKNIFSSNQKHLYIEKEIYSNKNLLLIISKFIDHKINSNTLKFRSKNNHIFIDEISKIIANKINTSDDTKLFKNYISLSKKIQIKIKEQKVFKYLLAEKLIILLSKIKSECTELSFVITESAKTKKVYTFNKQILNLARDYSILKFNPHSSFLIKNEKGAELSIKNLISELFFIERKIKIIILYLTNIFS